VTKLTRIGISALIHSENSLIENMQALLLDVDGVIKHGEMGQQGVIYKKVSICFRNEHFNGVTCLF